MDEPSVLDFIKSKILPWKYPAIVVPGLEETETSPEPGSQSAETSSLMHTAQQDAGVPGDAFMPAKTEAHKLASAAPIPWISLAALALAVFAQASLGPAQTRGWGAGVILLALALLCLVIAVRRGEWQLEETAPESPVTDPPSIHFQYLVTGTLLAVAAFFSYNNLLFTPLNLLINLVALFFILRAFWIPANPTRNFQNSIKKMFQAKDMRLEPVRVIKSVLIILAVCLVAFFRFYNLEQTPGEMNSDHAEKILDISRVLAGQTSIFFPNNGGREALQMYLVAALNRFFNIPLGFTALKLSSALVGFLALPFIYLLGKEIGSRRIGFLAFLFAGVAYWPNVISRLGLRLPFYVLFTAATMLFLIRGFRRGSRNDFILAGAALGLSFYGYSADRLLPLLVLAAFALYLVHPHAREKRTHLVISFLALVTVSFVIFVPLLRYIVAQPDNFLFRTLTRMGDLEQPLTSSPITIFFSNFFKAFTMFSWSGGVVWPASIPNSPALGVVAGALFYLGAGLLLIRYIRKRQWQDSFLLLSIPILFLPSVLALAFPSENPNLYRTGGALVSVFLMVAIALDSLITSLANKLTGKAGKGIAWALAILLFVFSAAQDYDLVFKKYDQQFRLSAWNTSEMGRIVRDFVPVFGTPDTVWVMGMAHWVDTRLVAIQAGYPTRDFALFVEQLPLIQAEPRAKLFILRPDDQAAIAALPATFPRGWFQLIDSQTETKDFLIFIVPPQVTP